MEDIVAQLKADATTLEQSQADKNRAPLSRSHSRLSSSRDSEPNQMPIVGTWKNGFTLDQLKFNKNKSGTAESIDAAASSQSGSGNRASGSGARTGIKFVDLGSTQYSEAEPSKPKNQVNTWATGASMKDKEAPKMKGKMRDKVQSMKPRPAIPVHNLSGDSDSASSDEMNISEASEPIENPIKPGYRKACSQVIKDSDTDDSASWAKTKNRKNAKASSSSAPSKAKSRPRSDENITSDDSRATSKVKIKPRPAYGGSKDSASDTTGLMTRECTDRKGKGKLIAALDEGVRPGKRSGNSEIDLKLKKHAEAKIRANPIQNLIDERAAEKTPRPVTKVTKDKGKHKIAPFPLTASSSTSALHVKDKGRQNLASGPAPAGPRHDNSDSDEDDPLALKPDDEILNYGGPRPFPMSSQDFAGFSNKPPSNSSTVSGSTKRESESDDERGPSKRRRKSNGMLDLPDIDDFSFTQPEERRDPKTLCPYCDMPFPTDASPLLRAMLSRIRNASYRDPRPSNALGLKAPLLTYLNMCQRHQFETTLLPKAHAKGWPTHIDFAGLPARVTALRDKLEGYLSNKDTSLFWHELKKEIDKKGVRKVMGVAGQFNTFEKSQPGYYGEQGAVIIYQTLYGLFPLENVDADRVAPLTPTEFIQRVLVPEAAAVLVQMDMGYTDKADAVRTLRESSKYGTAMFPDMDNNEGGGEDGVGGGGVGEKMVWERARARKKEIEEEDRMDNELEELEKERLERKANRARRADKNDKSDMSDVEGVKNSMRVKKGRKKATKTGGGDSEVIELSDSSARSDASSTSCSRKKRKATKLSKIPELATKSRSTPLPRESNMMVAGKPRPRYKETLDITSDPESDADATPKPPARVRKDVNARLSGPSSLFKSNIDVAGSQGSIPKSKLAGLTHPLEMAKTRKSSRLDTGFVYSMRDQPSESTDDEVEEVERSLASSTFPRVPSSSSNRPKSHQASISRQNPNAWLLSDDSTPSGTPPA